MLTKIVNYKIPGAFVKHKHKKENPEKHVKNKNINKSSKLTINKTKIIFEGCLVSTRLKVQIIAMTPII